METLIFANTKGGVCKTHLSFHVAKELSNQGKRVLCLDLDQQGHLVKLLRLPEMTSFANAIMRGTDINESLYKVNDYLYCLYTDESIRDFDLYLLNMRFGREVTLANKLEHLFGSFDYMVVDMPPNISTTVINGFTLPNAGVIIPVLLNHLSLDGLYMIEETLKSIRQYINPNLKVRKVVICRDNIEISEHAHSCREMLEKRYNGILSKANFPHSIQFVTAAHSGLSIKDFAKEYKVAKGEQLSAAMDNLLAEIIA